MLQTLGFIVDAVPRIIKCVRQVRLDDPMTANSSQCRATAGFRESYPTITLVSEQSLICETPHHSTHRGGRNVELLSDVIRCNRDSPAADLVDGLEIILDRT